MNNIFVLYCIIAVMNAVPLVKGIYSLKVNDGGPQSIPANDIVLQNGDFSKRIVRHAFSSDEIGTGYPYVWERPSQPTYGRSDGPYYRGVYTNPRRSEKFNEFRSAIIVK